MGAALVAHREIAGVLFTGSTEVARIIQRALARRLGADGGPIPLIAETGGQNALIVDSSALAEQVVADVLSSAFDSAGQRCSALRVLCLQEDVAERIIAMLKAAMAELSIGSPDRLSTDLGPVISREALAMLTGACGGDAGARFGGSRAGARRRIAGGELHGADAHRDRRRRRTEPRSLRPGSACAALSARRAGALIDELNASGYALTGGVHSRIDATIDLVSERLGAGNIYVNRNIIGAVVGVQPFGGHGLSGTGPKAGGPLYLKRLLAAAPPLWPHVGQGAPPPAATKFCAWLAAADVRRLPSAAPRSPRSRASASASNCPGPVGEQNFYSLRPRGAVLCHAAAEATAIVQVACALSTGNRAVLDGPRGATAV